MGRGTGSVPYPVSLKKNKNSPVGCGLNDDLSLYENILL